MCSSPLNSALHLGGTRKPHFFFFRLNLHRSTPPRPIAGITSVLSKTAHERCEPSAGSTAVVRAGALLLQYPVYATSSSSSSSSSSSLRRVSRTPRSESSRKRAVAARCCCYFLCVNFCDELFFSRQFSTPLTGSPRDGWFNRNECYLYLWSRFFFRTGRANPFLASLFEPYQYFRLKSIALQT